VNARAATVLAVLAALAATAALVLQARRPAPPQSPEAPVPPAAGRPGSSPPTSTTAVATTVPASQPTTTTTISWPDEPCQAFGGVTLAGRVAAPGLAELSGLAGSRRSPGVLWGHNDSRGKPEVFAIGPAGEDLGAVSLTGASAFDWEDIAAGPGPDGTPWLYVGDIGDNFAIRDGRVQVYAVPEPAPGDPASTAVTVMDLRMPDGPVDAEALLVDPIDGALYLVTKEADRARVYRADPIDRAPTSLALVASVDVGAPVTAGDISPDGAVVTLRGYDRVWMWPRPPGTPLATVFDGTPCRAPLGEETQGEAIAFLADGSYVTSSEGRNPPLHLVPRG